MLIQADGVIDAEGGWGGIKESERKSETLRRGEGEENRARRKETRKRGTAEEEFEGGKGKVKGEKRRGQKQRGRREKRRGGRDGRSKGSLRNWGKKTRREIEKEMGVRKAERAERGEGQRGRWPHVHQKITRYHTIISGGVSELRDPNMQMLVPLLRRGKTSSALELKIMSAALCSSTILPPRFLSSTRAWIMK